MKKIFRRRLLLVSTALAVPTIIGCPDASGSDPGHTPPADPERDRIAAESAAERIREMKLLGITALTPTVSARSGKPDFANFDEAGQIPSQPARSADHYSEREGHAGQPNGLPAAREIAATSTARSMAAFHAPISRLVSWRVAETVEETIGKTQVVTRKLIGHVDNAGGARP